MNTFKRKALLTAVLAGLGAGVAYATPPPATAHPTVYPYYTLQAGASAPTLVHEYVAVVAGTRQGFTAVSVDAGHAAGFVSGIFANELRPQYFIRYHWESTTGPAPSATS